jgi:hypothetical protein
MAKTRRMFGEHRAGAGPQRARLGSCYLKEAEACKRPGLVSGQMLIVKMRAGNLHIRPQLVYVEVCKLQEAQHYITARLQGSHRRFAATRQQGTHQGTHQHSF